MQYRQPLTGTGVVGLAHKKQVSMLQKKLYGMASQKLMNFIVINNSNH